MYCKNMSMKTIIFFIIAIVNVINYFGDDKCCKQCCEHCCEYLESCFCNKEKNEEEEEENDKNSKEEKAKEENDKNSKEEKAKEEEDENSKEEEEEAKVLVNGNWLNKKNNIFLKIFNKNENEYKSGNITIKLVKEDNDKTKIANLEEVEEKLKTNKHTWALFEIIYKEKKEEGEVGKMVYLYCSDIENSENNGIFDSCKQHISISVIACDTSNVTNMSSMFSDCSSLQQLDLTNFNTGNVKDMSSMFWGCKALTELDLSKFDTKNVIDMSSMFSGCASLQTVTFNKNLNNKIIQQLIELGLTEEVVEEGNKITLKKNN